MHHKKLQALYRLSVPFSFFNDFILIYPICNSMFMSYGIASGEQLTITKFTSLFILKHLSKMCFDAFSGILGDKYGRKKLIISAQLLRMITMILWMLWPGYQTFVGGAILLGIAMSCFYSNIDAYTYDQLRIINRQEEFAKFMGIYYATSNVAITLAAFISSAIFPVIGFSNILLLCVLSIAISIIFAHLLPNHYVTDTVKLDCDLSIEAEKQKISLQNCLITLKQNPKIIFFAVLTAISDALFIIMIDLNTITMINIKLQEREIAMLVGLMSIVRTLANVMASYTVKFFTVRLILLCLGGTGILLCYTTYYYNYLLVFTIMSYMVLSAFLDLSIRTRLQGLISSSFRATFMSISSLMSSIITIALYLIYSVNVVLYSNKWGMYAIGITLFCISSIMLVLLKHNKTSEQHARIT